MAIMGNPIRSFLQKIMVRGTAVIDPGKPAKDPELSAAFKGLEQALAASVAGRGASSLKLAWSYGKGRICAVPWFAFLDNRETSTTQEGVYVVFLFRRDMSGVYLTLNQGVTALKKHNKARLARDIAQSQAAELRAWCAGLDQLGFKTGAIDLRTEDGLALDYVAATVAHKLYERDHVPNDAELEADLQGVLEAYRRYVEQDESPQRERRSWIFQANPNLFDLTGAVHELPEITFNVNQHARDVHKGDTVFLWESGEAGGVVAETTVGTDPAPRPQLDEEKRFNRAGGFEAETTRVLLHIDFIPVQPFRRRELLDHPVLKHISLLKARGTNFSLTPAEAKVLRLLIREVSPPAARIPQVFKISVDAEIWAECRDKGFIALDTNKAEALDTIKSVQRGDIIAATRGTSEVLAVGEVVAPGYQWQPERADGKHTVTVRWTDLHSKRVPRQKDWLLNEVFAIPEALRPAVLRPGLEVPPNKDLATVVTGFSAAIAEARLSFGKNHTEVIRSFVAALAAKRFAILTGLSGSGKTQIALRLGEWLGRDGDGRSRSALVAVRPDWTGPEPLLGYEDALQPPVGDRKIWQVPPVLRFILRAAANPDYPYLLVLDEMNLAHVERYFADFLSGMESGEACLPNLTSAGDKWLAPVDPGDQVPLPENLIVVGTVNVDETTYMFSPKVLDRANSFEFRVDSEDLTKATGKPLPCAPGDDALVRGFLSISADEEWQVKEFAPGLQTQLAGRIEELHRLLSEHDLEFGHRVFYEMTRFALMMASAGDSSVETILDRQVYQKVLPRLHGTRRRLEQPLRALAQFCFNLTYKPKATVDFKPEEPPTGTPVLPDSFAKLQRMYKSLRINQFTSFTG